MCRCVRQADRLDALKPNYTVNDISSEFAVTEGAVDLQCTRFKTRIRPSGNQVRHPISPLLRHCPDRHIWLLWEFALRIIQHIRLNTDQGEFKGHVKKVQGKAVQVTPHAQFIATAKITSVVTIGKEELTGAQTSRADLTLDAFKGGDALLSTPFVRKIFFPEYPLQKLKWPALPTTQPKIASSSRQLNPSQERALEKCLSNKEEDRLVVIIVGPASSLSPLRFTKSIRDRLGPARPP